MPEFLIYVANERATDAREVLPRYNLAGLAAGRERPAVDAVGREVANGPAGQPGVVFGWIDPSDPMDLARVAYLADSQTWTELAAIGRPAGAVWVGREPLRRASPACLMRPKTYDGREVQLDDGQGWRIPLVRLLPAEFHLRGDTVIPVVQESFRGYSDTGVRIYDDFMAGMNGQNIARPSPITVAEFWKFVASGLCMNYTLCLEVIEALGLLVKEQTVLTAGLVAIDWPHIDALIKKKALEEA